MSIIYEALKKAGKAHLIGEEKSTEDKKRFVSYKTYAVYLSVVVLGFVCAALVWGFMTKRYHPGIKSNTGQAKAQVLPESGRFIPSAALPAENTPIQEKKDIPSELVLNGVFFSDEQGYALINNQVVKEGDVIEGAVVKAIGLKDVLLSREGKSITLESK